MNILQKPEISYVKLEKNEKTAKYVYIKSKRNIKKNGHVNIKVKAVNESESLTN